MRQPVDAAVVRGLREARGWSQEHLAEAAGLSARTIQRLEQGRPAASETLMALAASFEVTPEELLRTGKDEAQALADLRLSFGIHLVTFVFVIGVLVALNLARRPDDLWVLWPAIGWGLGVAGHGLACAIATQAGRQAAA